MCGSGVCIKTSHDLSASRGSSHLAMKRFQESVEGLCEVPLALERIYISLVSHYVVTWVALMALSWVNNPLDEFYKVCIFLSKILQRLKG